jgi:hypothetical protein
VNSGQPFKRDSSMASATLSLYTRAIEKEIWSKKRI